LVDIHQRSNCQPYMHMTQFGDRFINTSEIKKQYTKLSIFSLKAQCSQLTATLLVFAFHQKYIYNEPIPRRCNMTSNPRSRLVLLSLLLAIASLMAVFAILEASTANASRGGQDSPLNYQPTIIITPTELQANLHPDELISQTLWITNTTDNPITFTLYEMTAPLSLSGYTLEPAQVLLVDPEVQAQVTTRGRASVIISLREVPDISQAYQIPDKLTRREYVYQRLQESASHNQSLFDWLVAQGAEPKSLPIANAIAAQVDASLLTSLAKNSQVREISLSRQYMIISDDISVPMGPQSPSLPSFQPDAIEWNILKIRADEAWNNLGITGQGAVVGLVDTGVMYDHPALVNSYRGNLGDGNFDHNYSWIDFVNHSPAPYDDNGHGTMGAGIVSGDDGAGNQIGVAPGAKWIAAKGCTGGGSCSDADLLAALEWMLAPTDVNGQNPDPAIAPDVVLGMWGGAGCDDFFEPILAILRAAGILPVFSPGGGGPACNTIGSPADSGSVVAAGATDQNDLIAPFSSRGPTCYGTIKPDLSAPGVNIRTSTNDGGYTITSGTSWSAAHAAGAAGMVISADPSLGVDEVLDILYTTALCIDDDQCGGGTCPEPNNVYGHGRIDVYQAVYEALSNPPHVELPWLSEEPISATLPAGEGTAITVTFNSAGLESGTYTGALGILSSDPDQPFSSVPVTLQVLNPPVPIITIDPMSFAAILNVCEIQTDTLTISNQGDAVLSFTLYEISSSGRLTTPPVELSLPDPYPASTSVQVDAGVRTQLLFLEQARLMLYLRGQVDYSSAYRILDRSERGEYVYDQLLRLASQSDDLYDWLLTQDTQPHRLLTANAIAATLDASQLETVLSFPQVGRVGMNTYANVLQDSDIATSQLFSVLSSPLAVEWNIAKIRASETWSTFGITGQGATVGIVDTSVMLDHPALNAQYRGNLGDGNYNHNYNWYDLINGLSAPYDDHGHGTFGAGIAVGDDGGANQIGVAPGATWIAVKALDQYGGATFEQLHAGLEWMLAPTDLNGANPDPSMAPHVVLNMWRISGCDHSFDADLDALRAANILPVFAPGSEGPECGSVASPASDPDALSAGATDSNDVIASFSANGPSCYDGSVKPDVVAPGVEIRSSTNDGSYDVWSGTAFSTAHLAGAAALLFSANQQLSIDQLEQILLDTAVCLDDVLYCGGEACPGANNIYGHGRIDVFEAVSSTLGSQFDLPWLIAGPLSAELLPGDSMQVDVIFTTEDMQPGTYFGGVAIESNDPQAPFTILPVSLTVTADCQPITDLSMDITGTFRVGDVLTFTASASGTLPITYTWNFGDGSIATGEQVTHSFESVGVYFVWLTVENACSGSEISDWVTIYEPRHIWLPIINK
jgi:subtilisin family serine protease